MQRHQKEIEASLAEAEVVLDSPDPARAKALALIRWQLMRHLRGYQLFKHVEMFDPICRGGDAMKVEQASAMKARYIVVADAYDQHVKKWSAGGVDGAFAHYEAEARAMIALIRRHLAGEAEEAANLLSHSAPQSRLQQREPS